MKTIDRRWFAVSVLMVAGLAGCGGGGSSADGPSGDWEMTDGVVLEGTWNFDDGKVTISEDAEGSTCAGSYKLDNATMTIKVACTPGGEDNPDGYERSVVGTIVDEDTITLDIEDGQSDATLTRVGDA